jgi:hypothetical protein
MKRTATALRIAVALALAAMAAPAPARADDAVTARALLDSDRIGEADSVNLTIEVRGAKLPAIEEPDLSAVADFTVVSGPNVSTSTSMVWDGAGAQVSAVKKYTYTLMPKRRGSLSIPALEVRAGGKPLKTDPLQIEVVSGAVKQPQRQQSPFQADPLNPFERRPRNAPEPAGDVFVEATLDRPEAYVGQQALLIYKLYTQLELAALPQPRSLPAYTGFWVQEIPVDPQATIKRVVVRGKEYIELTLMKKALFPTTSGDLPIEDTTFEILVRVRGDDPFDAFFNPSRPLFRRTTPMTLKALPLPEAGRPASFQGAVGRFALKVQTDRSQAQVNDAVGLTVKVEGDGNLKAIGEPLLPDLPDYKRFDPKVEEEEKAAGDRIQGTRTWSYVLVPLAAGDKTIPPVRFAYFDPTAKAYHELAGPPLEVKVTRGTGAAASGEIGGGVRRDVVAVGRDIRYIKPSAAFVPSAGGFSGSALFWTLMLLPVAGNAAVWTHLRRRREQAANVGLFRGRRASRAARRRLKEATRLLAKNGAQGNAAFFAELDRALTGYMADKFNEGEMGITRERIAALLEERGVPEDLRRRALSCLERCDFGRFAPRSAGRDQMAALLAQGDEVIRGLERALS